jgi:hypothetical protein
LDNGIHDPVAGGSGAGRPSNVICDADGGHTPRCDKVQGRGILAGWHERSTHINIDWGTLIGDAQGVPGDVSIGQSEAGGLVRPTLKVCGELRQIATGKEHFFLKMHHVVDISSRPIGGCAKVGDQGKACKERKVMHDKVLV